MTHIPQTSRPQIEPDWNDQEYLPVYSHKDMAITDNSIAWISDHKHVRSWGYPNTPKASCLENVVGIYPNSDSFAILNKRGGVLTWGNSSTGGDSGSYKDEIRRGVTVVQTISSAIAVLKKNGTVLSWGTMIKGQTQEKQERKLEGVHSLYSNNIDTFLAIEENGRLYIWGTKTERAVGYIAPSSVQQVYGNLLYFALLQSEGYMTFVDIYPNPELDRVTRCIHMDIQLSDLVQVCKTTGAFAFLKRDGNVTTWGDTRYGAIDPRDEIQQRLVQVQCLRSTNRAFTALKMDGTAVVWGDTEYGGDPLVASENYGISNISSTTRAFALIRSDGSVYNWGDKRYGGNCPNIETTRRFSKLCASPIAFLGIEITGGLFIWGGDVPQGMGFPPPATNVVDIWSNRTMFILAHSDSQITKWSLDFLSRGPLPVIRGHLDSDEVGRKNNQIEELKSEIDEVRRNSRCVLSVTIAVLVVLISILIISAFISIYGYSKINALLEDTWI